MVVESLDTAYGPMPTSEPHHVYDVPAAMHLSMAEAETAFAVCGSLGPLPPSLLPPNPD